MGLPHEDVCRRLDKAMTAPPKTLRKKEKKPKSVERESRKLVPVEKNSKPWRRVEEILDSPAGKKALQKAEIKAREKILEAIESGKLIPRTIMRLFPGPIQAEIKAIQKGEWPRSNNK